MHRYTFPLPTDADRNEFQTAGALLRKALAGGWTATGVDTSLAGGLPAGRFLLTLNAQNQAIPFRLEDRAIQGFRELADALSELPSDAGRIVDGIVEGTGEEAKGVVVVTSEKPARRRGAGTGAASARRSGGAKVVAELRAAELRRPSVYDLTEAAALKGLRSGEGDEAAQVRALLGDEYFGILSDLARKTPPKRRGGAGKALVLPGIMGSKLGTRKNLFGLVNYSDVIWLDPVDMRLGRLDDLKLTRDGRAQNGTQPVGVLYACYLRLKLNLDLAGFDADFHPYDWRRPVRDLGREFAAFLNNQPEPVTIVAHSMGGIVTRAAIKAGAKREKIRRVIMLGTPNHGSFVPAQAMRAAYPFLKTLSIAFDRDLTTVTEDVFSSFTGLYDLLAATSKFSNFPLFDPTKWPQSRPRVRADLIEAARDAQSLLAPADERFHLICGVNQDTIVDVRVEKDAFVFLQNKDGDGTVPRISAELPGCSTLYVDGSHGMLPNYGSVCDLAIDLATYGKTSRPTLQWTPPTEPLTEVRETDLRRAVKEVRGIVRGTEPTPEAMRAMIEPLIGLPSIEGKSGGTTPTQAGSGAGATGGGGAGGALFNEALTGVVVGRRRQRQLEVALFPGSLTAVPSRAYVLGLFEGVVPTGAARAVDDLAGGVIGDFVHRRMLSGRLGEVFILPKGRSFLLADYVIFVGLGSFDRFEESATGGAGAPDAMRLACESVVRTCLRANIEEFATILLGGSAAKSTDNALSRFTRSLLEALKLADPDRQVRKVTLCENDPEIVSEIRTGLLRLATKEMFEEVELELRDLPPSGITAPRIETRVGGPLPENPVYVLTRMFDPNDPVGASGEPEAGGAKGGKAGTKADDRKEITIETSLLLPQSKAAVLTVKRRHPASRKDELLNLIGQGGIQASKLEELGNRLADFAFDAATRDALRTLARESRNRPLVVVHDAVAAQLPWEAFRFEDWIPAMEGGVCRQHLDANLSVAKWLERRVEDPVLDVLLVTDPTGDLEGAEAEGAMIRDLLSPLPNVRLTERLGEKATRDRLLTDFRSGEFDVIHYAGHAYFAPQNPGRSGLMCANGEVLAGVDLGNLGSLPSLIFFNACESGRIRSGKMPGAAPGGAKAKKQEKDGPREKAVPSPVTSLSVAAALIRGGVANFLGTYWPVGDTAAKVFSETFYPLLVKGERIGEAVLQARNAVKKASSPDWADYILYGDPGFRLKRAEK